MKLIARVQIPGKLIVGIFIEIDSIIGEMIIKLLLLAIFVYINQKLFAHTIHHICIYII